MGRKRKVPVADEEKENGADTISNSSMMLHGPMFTIMSHVQQNETFHKKYIKEMKQLYTKMDHDAFMFTYIKMIKAAMAPEEGNEYAHTTLLFCSKFVSSYDGEETHPLLIDTFNWLLTTISNNPHIRFRLCQFVNMILNALGHEAALDDAICDRIMEYMMERLRDLSSSVRVQAILALQRLQVPDNPDDPVLRVYQFHLCSDPSPRVRQAVITCMGRNYHTIPYILERLWDIDEKVRRHTYLHMSSYPVRSYKVSQRLLLLNQGLNDRSESVNKVVSTIMLQQWIESYQKNLISLISALKLDSNEEDIDRFRKITKQTLKEIFKRQNKQELIECIPLEIDGEFHRCVPHDKLTIEIAFYWQCLTGYLQADMAEEFDLILPELSTFCTYIERYCQSQQTDMDKFELLEFQYILLSLMEILYIFDLGDEIGRGNLKKLLGNLLKNFHLDEKIIQLVVKCAENLITDQTARLQYFVEIIQDICDLNAKQNELNRNVITELLRNSSDADLNLKLSAIRVKILDLEEKEMDFTTQKNYVKAQQITEEKDMAKDQYNNLLKPLLEQYANAESHTLQLRNVVKPENILKGLQLTYHMVVSPKVVSLNPSICKLYKDFICRHIASNQIVIRDWALKCGTAYSMLYETGATEVFEELYSQFFKNHNIRIWKTSIMCIFELLDRYGVDHFVVKEAQIKLKKSARRLHNTLEFLDTEDESGVSSINQGVGVIYMMSHFLDTCNDVCIVRAIIQGFCRLVLRGYIKSSDIIEKLLLRYFNPSTGSEINQMLGVFLENLIERKKHNLLQCCLLPTISSILSAPYDSPLHEIRPETVTRFIIDATRQDACTNSDNIHNKIAQTFLQEMLNNTNNKELCKLLAKEIATLEISVMQNEQLKGEMKAMADTLIKSEFDPKTIKNIIHFKDMLEGNFNPSSKPIDNESEDENKSDDETTTATEKDDKEEVSQSGVSNATLVPLPVLEHKPKSPSLPADDSENVAPTVAAEKSKSPSVAADDNEIISPSSGTPTTFGRENTIGHRYLRKSLNLCQSQSDSEAGDGPSRPPKIRIEARFDSDKKAEASGPKESARTTRATNSRAKRNLRYGPKNTKDVEEDSSAAGGDNEMVETTKANDGAKKSKNSEIQQQGKGKSPTKIHDKTPRSAAAKNVNNSKMPVRVTRRNAARRLESPKSDTIATRTRSADREAAQQQDSIIEQLNTSEVIPATPPHAASPQTPFTRLRRAATGNASLRLARGQVREESQPTKTAEGNQHRSDPPVLGASKTTAIRNARKRILDKTPRAGGDGTVTKSDNQQTTSPLRKQLRIDSSAKSAATPPDSNKPFSPEERAASASGVEPAGQNKDVLMSSPSSDAAKRKRGSSNISFQSARSMRAEDLQSITTSASAVLLRSTTTRNSTTKEQHSKLPRLRSKLPYPVKTQANKKPAPSHTRTILSKIPCKIPVRSTSGLLKKPATSKTVVNDNSSGSSSSTDESTSALRCTRNRVLTTKMTRINLTPNKSGPVPMRLARPTRALTPTSQVTASTTTRSSRRRLHH